MAIDKLLNKFKGLVKDFNFKNGIFVSLYSASLLLNGFFIGYLSNDITLGKKRSESVTLQYGSTSGDERYNPSNELNWAILN